VTAVLGRLESLADGVWAYVQPGGGWFVNNVGVLDGPDGLTLVDTCATERRTRALVEAVHAAVGRPAVRVVNTHHHGDHTYGNHLVGAATIVAHESVRAALERWGTPPRPHFWAPVEWGDIRLTPPTVTFADRVVLRLGRDRAEVVHVGTPAHTSGDAVVWLPDERILFAGDLVFNGVTPLVAHGSVEGTLEVLDRLESLGPRVVVPGHGPVGGPETLSAMREHLHLVADLAERAVAAGWTPLQTARRCDPRLRGERRYPERIGASLHRAMAELGGLPRGARIDSDRAFADMVAFHGGLLPTEA